MKTPKTIKAIAVVDKENPKLNTFDIFRYRDEGISLMKNEQACLVEIKFIKFVK